jgi:hypothetical protein
MDGFVGRIRARPEGADVVALCGFLDDERDGKRRLFADADLQKYMEFTSDEVVDAEPLQPERGDPGPRAVVWVKGDVLRAPLFSDEELEPIERAFTDRGVSGWQFLPETRFIAAGMLGLLEYEEGEYR